MPKKPIHQGQLVMFPGGTAASAEIVVNEPRVHQAVGSALQSLAAERPNLPVVLSGSYRKDFEGLKKTYEQLIDIGCKVLSPSNVVAVNEVDGFVFMEGEETQSPFAIEAKHLDAIQRSEFVWLHAPQGYVGPTAALEIGFAHAAGIPIFSKEAPVDQILRSFVKVVGSPAEVVATKPQITEPPRPALTAFQEYYKRAALQRGYSKENAKDTLILMVEEVGELARAIRKRENLTRHSANTSNEAHELADVFLYVVHMANVLDLDLSKIVQNKELLNLQRALSK